VRPEGLEISANRVLGTNRPAAPPRNEPWTTTNSPEIWTSLGELDLSKRDHSWNPDQNHLEQALLWPIRRCRCCPGTPTAESSFFGNDPRRKSDRTATWAGLPIVGEAQPAGRPIRETQAEMLLQKAIWRAAAENDRARPRAPAMRSQW